MSTMRVPPVRRSLGLRGLHVCVEIGNHPVLCACPENKELWEEAESHDNLCVRSVCSVVIRGLRIVVSRYPLRLSRRERQHHAT